MVLTSVVVRDARFVCRSSKNKPLTRESHCVLNAKRACSTFLGDLVTGQCTFLVNSASALRLRSRS
jgi:hypothetical protein